MMMVKDLVHLKELAHNAQGDMVDFYIVLAGGLACFRKLSEAHEGKCLMCLHFHFLYTHVQNVYTFCENIYISISMCILFFGFNACERSACIVS